MRKVYIDSACACHIGMIRANNEDNFYFEGHHLELINRGLPKTLSSHDSEGGIYAIFDGMGGEEAGETAAYLASSTLQDDLNDGKADDLSAFCIHANRRICSYAKRHGDLSMGSTAALLRLNNGTAEVANLGDSKAYLFRQGRLTQLSVDHTDAALLARSGATRKPRLTQYLGIPEDEMLLEPAYWQGTIAPGDKFLLCSDGLTDMVSEDELRSILTYDMPVEECADAMVERALSYGGKDNITVIVCVVSS